jgi:AMMECR1 domain-containing protein
VGNRLSCESLAENVPETTLRAALDDPRFPTVLGVDGEIDIEISILSPMKPIRDAARFASASTAPRSIAAAARRCCCRRWRSAATGAASSS